MRTWPTTTFGRERWQFGPLYYLVKIVTTGAVTYKYAIGKTITDNDGQSWLGNRLVSADAIKDIAYALNVDASGAIQQSFGGAVYLANEDSYSTTVVPAILNADISIGITTVNNIVDDTYILWLQRGKIANVVFMRDVIEILYVPKRQASQYKTLPQKTLTVDKIPHTFSMAVGATIPMLYGNWRSGIDIRDPLTDMSALFKHKEFVAVVSVAPQESTGDQQLIIADHYVASDPTDIAYFVEALNGFAPLPYGEDTLTDDIGVAYTGTSNLRYPVNFESRYYLAPSEMYSDEPSPYIWNGSGSAPQNAYDRNVASYSYIDDSFSGVLSIGYYNASMSFRLRALKDLMSQLNTELITYIYLRAKYELVGNFYANTAMTRLHLRKQIGANSSTPVNDGTGRSPSSTTTYTEYFAITEDKDTFAADPDNYFIALRTYWPEVGGEYLPAGLAVRLYECDIVVYFINRPFERVERTRVIGYRYGRRHAKLEGAMFFATSVIMSPTIIGPEMITRGVNAGTQSNFSAARYQKYTELVGTSNSPNANSRLVAAINGRRFGAWIDASRNNGYNSGDIIVSDCYIIEDILRNEFSITTITASTFDGVGNTTDGTRKDWKHHIQVTTKLEPDELFAYLCADSGVILTFSTDDTACIGALNYNSTPTRTVSQEELTKENDLKVAYCPEYATAIHLKYRHNAITDAYEDVLILSSAEFARYGNVSESPSNTRIGTPNTYTGLMSAAATTWPVAVTTEIEAASVRDDATAVKLIKWYADWLAQRRRVITFTSASMLCVDLEVGDIVKIETTLVTGVFIITSWALNVDDDTIEISALEMLPQGQ